MHHPLTPGLGHALLIFHLDSLLFPRYDCVIVVVVVVAWLPKKPVTVVARRCSTCGGASVVIQVEPATDVLWCDVLLSASMMMGYHIQRYTSILDCVDLLSYIRR